MVLGDGTGVWNETTIRDYSKILRCTCIVVYNGASNGTAITNIVNEFRYMHGTRMVYRKQLWREWKVNCTRI